MIELVSSVIAFGVLVWSGASHIANLTSLKEILDRQGIVTQPKITGPAIAITELMIGAMGLIAVFALSSARGVFIAAVAAAVLYVTYAGYATLLLVSKPGVPCGCSPGMADPLDFWIVGRAAALCLVAAYAATYAERGLVQVGGDRHTLAALLAGCAFVVLTWSLPSALAEPRSLRKGTL